MVGGQTQDKLVVNFSKLNISDERQPHSMQVSTNVVNRQSIQSPIPKEQINNSNFLDLS